jgi:hypothetical protein
LEIRGLHQQHSSFGIPSEDWTGPCFHQSIWRTRVLQQAVNIAKVVFLVQTPLLIFVQKQISIEPSLKGSKSNTSPLAAFERRFNAYLFLDEYEQGGLDKKNNLGWKQGPVQSSEGIPKEECCWCKPRISTSRQHCQGCDIVDDTFTHENIGEVSSQVESNTSPLAAFERRFVVGVNRVFQQAVNIAKVVFLVQTPLLIFVQKQISIEPSLKGSKRGSIALDLTANFTDVLVKNNLGNVDGLLKYAVYTNNIPLLEFLLKTGLDLPQSSLNFVRGRPAPAL